MFQTNDFLNKKINLYENQNLIDDLFSLNENHNLNNQFFNNNENFYNDNLYGNYTIIPRFEEQSGLINKTIPIKSVEKNRLLGRKRKNSETKGKHTKYNLDNRVRKVKVLLKDALLEFINSKMKIEKMQLILEIEGKKYIAEKLLNIRPKLMEDITIRANRTLIDTPIKDILSDDISGAYKNYPLYYNKFVIEKIIENKNNKNLIDILNMTFLECLKYYRKDKEILNVDKYACLKGLEKKYEDLPELLKKGVNDYDKKYEDGIINLIAKFEIIYAKKTPRSKKE